MIQLKTSDLPELREELLQEQNGICPICNKPVNRPVVDHEHQKRIKGSGQVRGVLCGSCNVFLAKSENNCTRYGISLQELPNVLRNIATYLESPQKPYMHPSEKPKEPLISKRNFNILIKMLKADTAFTRKLPEFPKSGKLNKELKILFEKYAIEPYN